MSIKKQYLKAKATCKVTFRLPKKAAPDARKAVIAGDFNRWQTHQNPMKHLKSGDFTVTLELDIGREYQYRFLVDDRQWITDEGADKYAESGYADSQNSVVVV